MVTQTEHFEQQRKAKRRNKHIQEDLDHIQNPPNIELTIEERERLQESYHLGMDMGIRIGKGKI